MSIPGFGVPSAGAHDDGGNPDDEFNGFGVPGVDSGEGGASAFDNPLGVFEARCLGPKAITAKDSGKRYLALEFELVGGELDGEEYSLMAEAFEADDDRAAKKKKLRSWKRIADACKAMGLAVGADMVPLDGWQATEGQTCRLAVSTYDKGGSDNPTIVWGKPKSRKRNGVEVGFPAELADDRGKFRDYGCGVLPPE